MYDYNNNTLVNDLEVGLSLITANLKSLNIHLLKRIMNLLPDMGSIRIGNSMVSRGIWHKYRERYFKIVLNREVRKAVDDGDSNFGKIIKLITQDKKRT